MHFDTPEDRLLNLIRGAHKKSSKNLKKKSSSRKKVFKIKDFFKKYFSFNSKDDFFVWDLVNKVLAAGIFILSAVFIYMLVGNDNNLVLLDSKYSLVENDTENDGANDINDADQVKGDSYKKYLQAIINRKLFAALAIEKKVEVEVSDVDVNKRFNLVGVIDGDIPQAVIEDKDTQKTHYMSKGQSLSGVVIEEISERKVILDYKGKKVALML